MSCFKNNTDIIICGYDKWLQGFYGMKCQQLQLRNFVRFSCKKSALVFTLIKHVSVLFFFFLGACVTWALWHVPLTLSILMEFHYKIEFNFVNNNFPWIAFQWFFLLAMLREVTFPKLGIIMTTYYWQHFVLILPYFSRDCPIFYMRKKVQKDLSDQDKLIQRFGDFTWW